MSYIKVSNLSYLLPDGTRLLTDVNTVFSGKCAIIGNNGVGKSTLAKIVAGELQPTSGTIFQNGTVYYSEQFINSKNESVADFLGITAVLDAIQKVSDGQTSDEVWKIVDNNWDIGDIATATLFEIGIGHIKLTDNTLSLSGGEYAKLNLVKAYLSKSDFLILDEPTNHLDQSSKKEFIESYLKWKKSAIIISHDREILDCVDSIYEISGGKINYYNGNYTFYIKIKEQEKETLESSISNKRAEYEKEKNEFNAKINNRQKTLTKAKNNKDKLGQPKIVLGAMKQNSEKTSAKNINKWNAKVSEIESNLADLSSKVTKYRSYLPIPSCELPKNKVIFEINNIILPFGTKNTINYKAVGGERIALVGSNGSGKSTLLSVLTGRLKPDSGDVKINVPYAFINQHMSDSNENAKDIVLKNSSLKEGDVRKILAQINLLGDRALLPFHLLSGGERLKVLITAELLHKDTPQLLILDEPTNHIDLESIRSLESMLNGYDGCILIVSHDKFFIDNININHYIYLD